MDYRVFGTEDADDEREIRAWNTMDFETVSELSFVVFGWFMLMMCSLCRLKSWSRSSDEDITRSFRKTTF